MLLLLRNLMNKVKSLMLFKFHKHSPKQRRIYSPNRIISSHKIKQILSHWLSSHHSLFLFSNLNPHNFNNYLPQFLHQRTNLYFSINNNNNRIRILTHHTLRVRNKVWILMNLTLHNK